MGHRNGVGMHRQQLLHTLTETTQALAAARAGFDAAWDRDLTEYYLYELSALGARHSHLLRSIQALDGKEAP